MASKISKAIALAALAGLGWAGGAAAQLPIEHIAREAEVSGVSMSLEGDFLVGLVTPPGEDGEYVALASWDLSGPLTGNTVPLSYITPREGRSRFIAASALKGGLALAVTNQAWSGTTRCLEGGGASNVDTFASKAYLTDRTISELEDAFTVKAGALDRNEAANECAEVFGSVSIDNILPLDPDHIVISRGLPGSATEYLKVNLDTDQETLLYKDSFEQPVIATNPRDGMPMVRTQITPQGDNDYTFETLLPNPDTGVFEVHDKLTTRARGENRRHDVDVAGYDEETGQYYVVTDLFNDKDEIYFYNPRTREFSPEPILAHPRFDATGVILGNQPSNFNQLLGFTYNGPRQKVFWLDPEMRSIYAGLEQAFPGLHVSVLDYNDGYNRILFSVSSSRQPPIYYLLVDKARPMLIGAERPWVDTSKLKETELVYYPARDGLQIPAFLTMPATWNEGDAPIPVVVLPHGGPWARDTNAWDDSGWPQFLASRGYAVLQPQYRGSTGFGRNLWLAGDEEWGQKMQDDKDDGAAWLVERGIGDPERMAIFGYSYGGFAAMAAVVRPNSPYACAIAGAGVANLDRSRSIFARTRVQRAQQGWTIAGMDPIENVDKANIPVMMYHGDRDVRVPLFHAEQFYAGVKDKVPARLEVIDDMPHSLPWWPEHHRKTLALIESYLDSTCGF